MGRKIYYKCPECGKTHMYESKRRYAPKNARTRCQSCRTQIYVKPNFIGAHRNQNVSSSQNWSKPIQPINIIPDKMPTFDSSKSDGCKNSSEITPKNESKNLSEWVSVSSASTSTGALIDHQNCNYDPKRMFSLHCGRFKFTRISEPQNFQWDKIQIMGRKDAKESSKWRRYIRIFPDFTLEITKYLLIINLSHDIYANNANDLEAYGKEFALNCVKYLFQFGFNCSTEAEFVQKPHIVIPKCLRPELPSKFLYSTSDGSLVNDDTPHNNATEFIGIEKLQQMAKTPTQIEQMAKIIQMQTEAIANQNKLISQLLGVVDENIKKEKEREKKNEHIYL